MAWDWVPAFVQFAFNLDGLAMLFAILITGIGLLIQIYAGAHMGSSPMRCSLQTYLNLFMLSMLGLVLSDNLLLLFVFWELTTLPYFLIGFKHENTVARNNALQSMLSLAVVA